MHLIVYQYFKPQLTLKKSKKAEKNTVLRQDLSDALI